MMDAEDLYLHIKGALNYFGLMWHEKDKITVSFEKGVIIFVYANQELRIKDT